MEYALMYWKYMLENGLHVTRFLSCFDVALASVSWDPRTIPRILLLRSATLLCTFHNSHIGIRDLVCGKDGRILNWGL